MPGSGENQSFERNSDPLGISGPPGPAGGGGGGGGGHHHHPPSHQQPHQQQVRNEMSSFSIWSSE